MRKISSAFKSHHLIAALLLILLLIVPVTMAQDAGIPVQFEGTVETAEENSATIEGFAIDLTQMPFFVPLEVGMVVNVEGVLTSDNTVIATSITIVENSPGAANGFEYTGVVDNVNGTTITVNGLNIDVSQATDVPELNEGDIVRVSSQDRIVQSVEVIEVDEENRDNDSEFKLTEVVTRVGENYLLVAGLPIVTVQAESPEKPIEVDAMVKIEGYIIEGILIASKIEVFERPDRETMFEVKGTVEEVTQDSATVSGIRVDITELEAELEPEDKVRVSGQIEDGNLVAESLERMGGN